MNSSKDLSTEERNLAWSCLPKYARDSIRSMVKDEGMGTHGMFDLVFGCGVANTDEPEQMFVVPRKTVMSYYKDGDSVLRKKLEDIFGKNNLVEPSLDGTTDLCVKPAFKKGDEVFHIKKKKMCVIQDCIFSDEYGWYVYNIGAYTKDDKVIWVKEEDLELSQTDETENSSKDIDLLPILKGYEGIKFYSLGYGYITYKGLVPERNGMSDKLWFINADKINIHLYKNGRMSPDGICFIFPSEELYKKYPFDADKAWQEWVKSNKKYSLTINCTVFKDMDCIEDECFVKEIKFKNLSDAQRAVYYLKRCSYQMTETFGSAVSSAPITKD